MHKSHPRSAVASLACLAFLAIAACASPAASTAPVRWNSSVEMCQAWAQVYCAQAAACGASVSVAACLANTDDVASEFQWCATEYAPLWAARTLGLVAIDDAAIAACWQQSSGQCDRAVHNYDCLHAPGLVTVVTPPKECVSDLECGTTGYCGSDHACHLQLKVGESCASAWSRSCPSDARCIANKCTAALPADSSCTIEGALDPCADGLFCDITCKPLTAILAACKADRGLPCWLNLYDYVCDAWGGCSLLVETYAAIGEPCYATRTTAWEPDKSSAANHSNPCAMGEACLFSPAVGPQVCGAELAVGAPCKYYNSCGTSLICDDATKKCVNLPTLGDACRSGGWARCAYPYVCNSLSKCGPVLDASPCKADANCRSKHCGSDGVCVM